VEEGILVPAVAEPLLVWILSGSALVEERDFGGTWTGREVAAGEFFLTTSPTPYELRWKVTSAENFENLLAYVGLPVFARALNEVRSTLRARYFFGPIEGEQLLRPAHAAKREPSHGRKPRPIGRGRCGHEFRRSKQIAVPQIGTCQRCGSLR